MDPVDIDNQVGELLSRMTLAEKIGQMSQLNHASPGLRDAVRAGRVGSVINEVNVNAVNELQRLAVEESRLGIPLLFGRDVIHGFKTVFPIPLGLAASWNPNLVAETARIAANEASAVGVNWTFAPMMDISRDPRWGRVAESFGEDPHLCKTLATAMIGGFQGGDLSDTGAVAACAKHFAGYGASEAGRDYNTCNIPEIELRNVYLPPFEAAVNAGVATVMTSFSELNGVPATGNEFLIKQILRQEWDFRGVVVSDWESIPQMTIHGFTLNDSEAAYAAASAGVDMEMASSTYANHLEELLEYNRVSEADIDASVARILRLKVRMGLFKSPFTDPAKFPALCNEKHMSAARRAAEQSCVLLRNPQQTLPLPMSGSLAVIGPMADEAREQLGTWVFDAELSCSQTPLEAIRALVEPDMTVHYARGLKTTRSSRCSLFLQAVETARDCDHVVVIAGEEAILSGEAHCRADISLPGEQEALIETVAGLGKPVVLVVMAGRPLELERVAGKVDAILYAWHPGSMGGPAIANLLFGLEAPSGKLPMTFPRTVGQVPIYYSQKNTGKPASADNFLHINDIETGAEQTSFGMSSMHLDAGFTPLFPFGFGLSYTAFRYSNIRASSQRLRMGGSIRISADVSNNGLRAAVEVVQLYTRDLVGSVTRPVRELKGFQRVSLEPGQTKEVGFELNAEDLAFFNRDSRRQAEPGVFHAWIGGSSQDGIRLQFELGER